MAALSQDDIQHAAGPLLLGYLLNYGLFGVLTVQLYTYYSAFPNDRYMIKALVYGVYVVEVLQTVLLTCDAFQSFVYKFGQGDALFNLNFVWLNVCITDGLVAFTVQIFYAYRAYRLSKSKVLMGVIIFIALAQFAGAFATGIITKAFGHGKFTDHVKDRETTGLWLVGSATCDIVITLSMTYILSNFDGGFKSTRNLVSRIIRLTMETGSLTATCALLDIILFYTFPKKLYHLTTAIILAKMYSNSLMVILNSRIKIVGGRGQSLKEPETSNSLGDLVFEQRIRQDGMYVLRAMPDSYGRQTTGSGLDSIQVTRDIQTSTDSTGSRREKIGF